MKPFLLLSLSALALGGCTVTGGGRDAGTEVTRYHLNQPIAPGSVHIEPLSATATISPEYQTYADAVAAELSRMGYTRVAPASAGASQYIAAVGFQRASRGTVQTPPRFSIGIGGGSFGRGGGLGGGLSTGLGAQTREVIVSELFVQLRRRSDETVVWEGRAQSGGLSRTSETQPGIAAGRLATALFRGFPGESGITTIVR
jgi:hypothetical protein